MPNRALIGRQTEATTVVIDADSVREFAKAVGETDAIHFDVEAARAAGFANVVAPATYANAFMAQSMDPSLFFELELNIMTIVHGEQEFIYHRPMVGGEELTLRGRVHDMWEKQGRSGTLDFVVLEAAASDAAGEPVYTSRITLISRRATEEEQA